MTVTPWGLGAVLRVHVSTVRAEAFESDLCRQVDDVEEHEPRTLIYGFYREGETDQLTTYLHTMAYADQAAQEAHWDREALWWWDTFNDYLVGEIESERFTAGTLLRAWSSADATDGALVVGIDTRNVYPFESTGSSAYGWMGPVASSEDSSVVHARSPGALVVASTKSADEAQTLAKEFHPTGDNVRIGRRKIAGMIRVASATALEQEA